jgi:hypothetical protein
VHGDRHHLDCISRLQLLLELRAGSLQHGGRAVL